MLLLNLFVVAVLPAAGLAQSITSDVASLPQCALGCLSPAITSAGCGQTDWTCICTTGMQIIKTNAFSCIIADCSTADALKTQQLAREICSIATGGSSNSSTVSGSSTATSGATSKPTTTFYSSTTGAASSTGKSSPTSSSTTSSTPTNAVPESSTSAAVLRQKGAGGLSKEAIAGIAVGAVFGGLFLIAVIVLIVFGYRKRQRDLRHLAAISVAADKPVVTDGPYELDGVSHVKELSSHTEVHKPESSEAGTVDRTEDQVERGEP